MGIYQPNFLQNSHCAIIHQNINVGIEYLFKKYRILTFSVKTTSQEFRLNITCAEGASLFGVLFLGRFPWNLHLYLTTRCKRFIRFGGTTQISFPFISQQNFFFWNRFVFEHENSLISSVFVCTKVNSVTSLVIVPSGCGICLDHYIAFPSLQLVRFWASHCHDNFWCFCGLCFSWLNVMHLKHQMTLLLLKRAVLCRTILL